MQENMQANEELKEQAKMQGQEKSLEQVLLEVENIIQRMQQKDISLEESFSLYQQGIEDLRLCSEKIDAVEKKLILLNEEQPE